jgi:hypothetical protein
MTPNEKYNNYIDGCLKSSQKEYVAAKTVPRCTMTCYRTDRWRCTFCNGFAKEESRYCPNCGAWNTYFDITGTGFFDDCDVHYNDYDDDDETDDDEDEDEDTEE